MDQTTHKIDPGGDVVLILRNPSAPFAVMVEPLTDSESAPSPAPSTSPTKTQTICSSSEPNPSEYRYLVSSRHLILASKYFKTTLQGPWKEATSTDADGRHTIHAHDWDPSALLVLMHILHNRPNSVPREIDLEEFAKLAVLVDYYRCHEVVSIYADIWKSKLSVCVPTKCNREFILWLVVALVFQFKDTLKHMQEVALLHSVEQIPTLGLPIAAISDKLYQKRGERINKMLTVLERLLDGLRDGELGCSFDCSSMLLGALTKQMHGAGLLNLRQQPPYYGHSVCSIISKIREFKTPDWTNPGYDCCDCSISDFIEEIIDLMEQTWEDEDK